MSLLHCQLWWKGSGQNNPLVDGILGELTNSYVQSPLQALALGSRPRPGITPPPYLPLPFQQLSLPLPGCSILCCPEYINPYLPPFSQSSQSLSTAMICTAWKHLENRTKPGGTTRPPCSEPKQDDMSGHLWSDEVCQQSKCGTEKTCHKARGSQAPSFSTIWAPHLSRQQPWLDISSWPDS